MNTHAFVTGATGFIGSNLVRELVNRQYSVSCLVRSETRAAHLKDERIELIHGDLCHPQSFKEPIKRADIIFHVAGVTKSANRAGFFHGNLETTRQLVQAMTQHGPAGQKLVYISSQAAAGPCSREPGTSEATANSLPVSAYGQSKKSAEQVVLSINDHSPVVILRPSIVFGPGDRAMLPLFKGAAMGIMPKSGARKFPVNCIYVDDLVEAIILAGESDAANGKTFFVTDGHAYNWTTLNNKIAACVNPRAFTLPIPLFLIWMTCHLNGLLERMTNRPFYLNPDKWLEIKQAGWLCSSARLREELGFRPRWSLEKGIKATVNWYREAGWL